MKKQRQEYSYDLHLRDSLLTISPITDMIPLAGGDEVELICTSGYHLRSYVTFVKEYIPCDTMKLKNLPGIKNVFTVRDRRLSS